MAREILRLIEDPNACADKFAEVISKDPALAAKLLKLANSSLFALVQEVTNLPVAALLLGLKTVQRKSLSKDLGAVLAKQGGRDRCQIWPDEL